MGERTKIAGESEKKQFIAHPFNIRSGTGTSVGWLVRVVRLAKGAGPFAPIPPTAGPRQGVHLEQVEDRIDNRFIANNCAIKHQFSERHARVPAQGSQYLDGS